MAQAIVMPSLGMYSEEGIFTGWLRAPGEHVDAGETVAEITTEKTTFEVISPASGILHPIATPGAALQVEALMGYILENGEGVPTDSRSAGIAVPANSVTVSEPAPAAQPARIIASPAARRLAAQNNIDLAQLTGSGPDARIVEVDVRKALHSGPQILERVPMAGPRQAIAKHLRSTLNTAVSTTLTCEAEADVLVSVRRRMAVETGFLLSYPALFIGILARALRYRRELNAAIENDCIVVFGQVHVGFALALPDGLAVPVVRNADRLSLVEIDRAVRDLSARALTGHLTPADVEGGTATITNLGHYGIDGFTPVLNGPQSAILGIGRIAERPVVRDGALAIGRTCVLSLTFDHRVADGVPAARLLAEVVRQMNDEQFLVAQAAARATER